MKNLKKKSQTKHPTNTQTNSTKEKNKITKDKKAKQNPENLPLISKKHYLAFTENELKLQMLTSTPSKHRKPTKLVYFSCYKVCLIPGNLLLLGKLS